jgi:hypothetical protein
VEGSNKTSTIQNSLVWHSRCPWFTRDRPRARGHCGTGPQYTAIVLTKPVFRVDQAPSQGIQSPGPLTCSTAPWSSWAPVLSGSLPSCVTLSQDKGGVGPGRALWHARHPGR